MDIRYNEVKQNKEGNYLLPFLWLCGGESQEDLRFAVESIYQTGARAFTIEPRGFSDFEKEWWEKLDFLFNEAEKRGMQVWIVDETQLPPTGHAYGLVQTKYLDARKFHLVEAHVDVIGPQKGTCLVLGKTGVFFHTEEQDELICAYAYKRIGKSDEIDIEHPILLTQNIKDNFLYWDIPEGAYRIFYIFKTRKYLEIKKDTFIDFINKNSVDILINHVYEDYYRRYGHLFGKTFVGFFSDEPSIDNYYTFDGYKIPRYCDTTVGTIGLTLAWTDELKSVMEKNLGYRVDEYLPALWYDCGGREKEIRFAYMDALSELYRVNFTERVGKWCKDHGMMYIGHVIEDNGLHCRCGHGAGHFFRAESGQDMPGIDIVMHQVMPGFADYNCTGCGYDGHSMDNEMFHYLLGKLNSSAAHTYSQYENRALCEVMIAYGWAEGTRLAKWLVDFLLVRGTNYFVTHAFRPIALDSVLAPHFGASDGSEPQFKGICKLLTYVNKASHLLQGRHIASCGILYHAFAEWYNTDGYMKTETVAKKLYDAHIDYDIISEDILNSMTVKDRKINILQAKYDCLLVPFAPELPKKLVVSLRALQNNGAKIVFVGGLPLNFESNNSIGLDNLAQMLRAQGVGDIYIKDFPYIRHYHSVRDENDVYMFFNEHVFKTFNGFIEIGKKGYCTVTDLLGDYSYTIYCDGELAITLAPYQSVIVVFGAESEKYNTPMLAGLKPEELNGEYTVSIAEYKEINKFKFFEKTKILKPLNLPDRLPHFSGAVRYEMSLPVQKTGRAVIEFENVGENAELFVNGKYCGMRICPPYRFDISDALREGNNEIVAITYNTLANAIQDNISMFIPLAPTGITGKTKIYKEKN